MFGLFKRRRRASSMDVSVELEKLRLGKEQLKLSLLSALASHPHSLHLAAAALFPGLAKVIAAPPASGGGSDPLHEVFIELVKENARRNPMKETLGMLSLLRGAKGDLAELIGEDDTVEPPQSDHLAVQLLSSPAVVELTRALAPAAAAFARQAPSVQTAHRDAPQRQPEALPEPRQLISPNQVLQLFQQSTPDQAAHLALEASRQDAQLTQALQALLNAEEDELPSLLRTYTLHPAWSPVAVWLLDHPDWTAAFLAHLAALISGADDHEPEAPHANGHGEPVDLAERRARFGGL